MWSGAKLRFGEGPIRGYIEAGKSSRLRLLVSDLETHDVTRLSAVGRRVVSEFLPTSCSFTAHRRVRFSPSKR